MVADAGGETLAFLGEMEARPFVQRGQWIQLGIGEPDMDALIGDVGLHLSSDSQTGEVGITLAPWAQGRGVASAAVEEALQLLFIATPVTRVVGLTDVRNTPSIRLLERLGFEWLEIRRAVFRGKECREEVLVRPRVTAMRWSAQP